LKKAVRGTIPDTVIDRPKQGFTVPVQDWFFDRLGDFARQELESFCKETDYLDIQQVRLLFGQHQSLNIWYLLNFAMWWKEFIAG